MLYTIEQYAGMGMPRTGPFYPRLRQPEVWSLRKMMKVAIRSAGLAAITGILCLAAVAQQKLPDAVPEQQQQQEKPAAQPAAAGPAIDGTPKPAAGAVETDPAKMGETGKAPATNSDPSYVIGPEDVLGISVWNEPRLTGPVMVRPDGRISMPLIGELTANGLTVNQLELAIADLLKKNDLIKTPQVTVQVTQINSKKYFIQGEVLRQGAFPLVVPTTVLEALVNAGFKDFANVKKIEIIRGTERLRFNYKDVIHGRHMEQNIMLKPGDMIIVP